MNICLVSNELLGLHKNGGIGTATSNLAVLFAQSGSSVTLLFVGQVKTDQTEFWVDQYRRLGIELTRIDPDQPNVWPLWLRPSSAVYEYLVQRNFDLILFPDWQGLGYASIVSKRAGISFEHTRLAVIAHGPTEWLLDANRQVAQEPVELAHIHMERLSFALADSVVSPSRYLLDWLKTHSYSLPTDTRSIPLYLWAEQDLGRSFATGTAVRVETLAYFGRLEERKGIKLFLEAIVSPALEAESFQVIFVGKPATLSQSDIDTYLTKRQPWLRQRVEYRCDFDSDQAQEYLIARGCLAVIPSLSDNAPCVISECLNKRIPFIAADTGGISELIDQRDHERTLFNPRVSDLTRKLKDLLGVLVPFEPARPAYKRDDVATIWLEWVHAASRPNNKTDAEEHGTVATHTPVSNQPLRRDAANLSVIVTHYERPQLLEQNLSALACQTCLSFELIIVDDGSTSDAAVSYLAKVESTPWPFTIRIIRQTNSYLGAARNAGIRAANADRLIFLDDDNVPFPNMIACLAQALDKLDADIVTSQMLIFLDPNETPPLDLLAEGERWGFTGGPAELGLSINCFGDATGIYRKSVFERIGMFHELRGVGHEDWHLHARAVLAGLRLFSLPLSLFWYRRTQSGMLNTTDQFVNNRIIWDAYKDELGPRLKLLADLSIRNTLVGG